MLERKRKLDCANGREKADLVLKNGNVLNVFTEEVLKADIKTGLSRNMTDRVIRSRRVWEKIHCQ